MVAKASIFNSLLVQSCTNPCNQTRAPGLEHQAGDQSKEGTSILEIQRDMISGESSARSRDQAHTRARQPKRHRADRAQPGHGGERLVGCGTGALLERILARRPDVEAWGVGISTEMIVVARGRLGDSVDLRVADAEALPLPDGYARIYTRRELEDPVTGAGYQPLRWSKAGCRGQLLVSST
jgi:hypothetical protein